MKNSIKKWLGVQYKHNGRSTDGIDCLGLVALFLRENGINIPDRDGRTIKKNWYESNPRRYVEGLSNYGKKIDSIDDLQPLDIICFRIDGEHITHSGVVIEGNKFIHILDERKVSVDRLNHRFWRKKFACGFRVRR